MCSSSTAKTDQLRALMVGVPIGHVRTSKTASGSCQSHLTHRWGVFHGILTSILAAIPDEAGHVAQIHHKRISLKQHISAFHWYQLLTT